jgi:hypothetical protein
MNTWTDIATGLPPFTRPEIETSRKVGRSDMVEVRFRLGGNAFGWFQEVRTRFTTDRTIIQFQPQGRAYIRYAVEDIIQWRRLEERDTAIYGGDKTPSKEEVDVMLAEDERNQERYFNDPVTVTILDTETEETVETTEYTAAWWATGNGSCDCNRSLRFSADLHTATCGNSRYIITAIEGYDISLAELNEGYPDEVLQRYGVIPEEGRAGR